MVGVSAVTSIVLLLFFRASSDQQAIRRAKALVTARLLEFVLFRDDFVVSTGALGRTLVANLKYLRHMVLPFAAALVPVLLLLPQLSCWFSFRPLRPGDCSLVKVNLADPACAGELSLGASDGLEIETPAFAIPSEREVDWRVRVRDGAGADEWVEVKMDDHRLRKQVVVSRGMAKVSPRRPDASLWQQMSYPVEAPVPPGLLVQAIEVTYPKAQLWLGGLDIHWLLAFFVLTVLFGLVLKRPLRVEL
jgi:hypothetical protein